MPLYERVAVVVLIILIVMVWPAPPPASSQRLWHTVGVGLGGGAPSEDTDDVEDRLSREKSLNMIKKLSQNNEAAQRAAGATGSDQNKAIQMAVEDIKNIDSWNPRLNFSEFRGEDDGYDSVDEMEERMKPLRLDFEKRIKLELFEERYEREKLVAAGHLDVNNENASDFNEDEQQELQLNLMDEGPRGALGGLNEEEFDATFGSSQTIMDDRARETYIPWLTEERLDKHLRTTDKTIEDCKRVLKARGIEWNKHRYPPGVRDPKEWLENPETESVTEEKDDN
mmetsp:Transcript_3239/g.4407  ORF Transcript_3239/g.4407 Transcript_3239/m.4407 type:complete len:283 (+) Transcript_3239:177-1025(+)